MCPLTTLTTCHLRVKTRIAVCCHSETCFVHACYSCSLCTCMLLSLCVCLNDRVPAWAPVSQWSCQRAVSMVMVLTRLACMRRGGAQSCSQRSIENLLHQSCRTGALKTTKCRFVLVPVAVGGFSEIVQMKLYEAQVAACFSEFILGHS